MELKYIHPNILILPGLLPRLKKEAGMNELGKKIKAGREYLGMSQGIMSQKTGVHKDTLGYIERGVHNPRYETLYKISKFFGVSISILKNEDFDSLKKRLA